MSTIDKENAQDAARLRQELKDWEKTFITANNGRKPGRLDIKKDTAIAAKYKEYDKLRKSSQKISPKVKTCRPCSQPESLRERSANALSTTPKRTPSKRSLLMPEFPMLSPVKEIDVTPAIIRCALGPTPQKDGQVLGIFDTLSTGTPSRSKPLFSEPGSMITAVPGTPSKSTAPSGPILSRTPQSDSAQFYLDAHARTPLKRKREEEGDLVNADKQKYATPSFLRRSFPLASVNEDVADPKMIAPPFKKIGLVRSLSSIIQGLRKQEEQRMDDEWDILNEIEEEEENEEGANKSHSRSKPSQMTVEDRTMEMPLGPDRIPDSEDESPDADGHGATRKPWKKKGLKRQTRRVIMRPVMHQPQKAEDTTIADEDQDEADKEVAVAGSGLGETFDLLADDDHGSSNHDQDLATDEDGQVRKEASPTAKPTTVKERSVIAQGVRKISAQAHANFRKLKIKNKNSKANGRGRFGRR